ncbi:MAG: FAD-binding oxidoreductase [Deltaproteobacteria bacterium]|nr:FAD-binding oxidoreductase [Deltaproteobacteria bacterium]
MAIDKKRLMEIFGETNVIDNETLRECYARDQSFEAGVKPDCIVFPGTVEQVQQVVKAAQETGTPLIPYSSGLNLHGAALAKRGGIIVNLSRMNKILTLDEENWFVMVEPGVTYKQLQDFLSKKGYRIMIPFGAPPDRSVLTSYLERDPVLSANSFEYGNNLIMDTELVLPDGEILKTGLWSAGGEPGNSMGPVRNLIFRLWTGAQGTLGIMTKMCLHIMPDIKERKIFFLTFEKLSAAISSLRAIQRKEIGFECFLLNRFNLAALLNPDWKVPEIFPSFPASSPGFDRLRSILPPWVLILSIQGGPLYPEEKIAYETEALKEVCSTLKIELQETLPQVEDAAGLLAHELLYPWGILKKFNYRGSVHDLSFKSPLQDIAAMEAAIMDACSAGGYEPDEVGAYVLCLERGRALHCEFDLHCDVKNAEEAGRVKGVWLKASENLMNQGALFDRPYGPWAEMVYSRAEAYAEKLKAVKREIDPAGIMNPGNLIPL